MLILIDAATLLFFIGKVWLSPPKTHEFAKVWLISKQINIQPGSTKVLFFKKNRSYLYYAIVDFQKGLTFWLALENISFFMNFRDPRAIHPYLLVLTVLCLGYGQYGKRCSMYLKKILYSRLCYKVQCAVADSEVWRVVHSAPLHFGKLL